MQGVSGEVKRIAQGHIADLDQKIAELQAMRRTLEDLVRRCRGDRRPDCPILDDLATEETKTNRLAGRKETRPFFSRVHPPQKGSRDEPND